MVRKSKEAAEETRRQIVAAARGVFHQMGVHRASLEMVAQAAGLTRGAIYWHFQDKTALFAAVKAQVLVPALEQVATITDPGRPGAPLANIQAGLVEFFRLLEQDPAVRMVLQTIVHRCEGGMGFATVHPELEGMGEKFLTRLETAYAKAAASGALRPGLNPALLARDTWAFANGLMYRLLAGGDRGEFRDPIGPQIALHLALRRGGGEGLAPPIPQKGRDV